jgi:hypothetical protein
VFAVRVRGLHDAGRRIASRRLTPAPMIPNRSPGLIGCEEHSRYSIALWGSGLELSTDLCWLLPSS